MVTIKCSCHLQFSRIGSIGPFEDSSYWLATETPSFHCRNHAYFCRVSFRGYKLPVNWKAHRCDCVVFKAFSSIQQEGQSEQLLADKHAPSKFPPELCWFVYSGPAVPYLCWPLFICEQYLSGNGASLLLHDLGSKLTPTMSVSAHGLKCEG